MVRHETIAKTMVCQSIYGICNFQVALGSLFQCTEVTGVVRGNSVSSKVFELPKQQWHAGQLKIYEDM